MRAHLLSDRGQLLREGVTVPGAALAVSRPGLRNTWLSVGVLRLSLYEWNTTFCKFVFLCWMYYMARNLSIRHPGKLATQACSRRARDAGRRT